MSAQVLVTEVVNRVHLVEGGAALSPETVHALAQALLPLVREMLAHDARVRSERSVDNGYLDHIERGGRS